MRKRKTETTNETTNETNENMTAKLEKLIGEKQDTDLGISTNTIKKFNDQIFDEQVFPELKFEITYNLKMRKIWDILGNVCFTLSILLTIVGSLLAFGGNAFPNLIETMSFLSGCGGSLATAFTVFSHYCNTRSSQATKKVNSILTKLGSNMTMPEMHEIQND